MSIVDYPKPKTLYVLHRFLSIINYYRRCLKNAASHQALLTEYLKNSRKKMQELFIGQKKQN